MRGHRHELFDEPFQAVLARAYADEPGGSRRLAGRQAVGVFEVDEGSLPEILPQVFRAGALIVANLFRE